MATVQITTWDEFKTALTETITEATTYEIMNDIDASNEIVTSAIAMVCNTDTSLSLTKTFNGNGYKINGITSYSSINIFISRYNFLRSQFITFNNLHFTNYMIENGALFAPYGDTGYSNTFRFYRCFFNGFSNSFITRTTGGSTSNWPQQTVFDSCAFNIEVTSTAFNWMVNLSNCYIEIDNSRASSGGSFCYAQSEMNNCYLSGTWKSNWSYLLNGVSYSYGSNYHYSKNNVLNLELSTTETSSPVYLFSGINATSSSAAPNLINGDKLALSSTQSLYNIAGQYQLTDAQLKSKAYIQENTSFPLYG